MSSPNMQRNGNDPNDFEDGNGNGRKEEENGSGGDSTKGKVSELVKRIRKQKYNFTARHKVNKEEAAEELAKLKESHAQVSRDLEESRFSHGLSKKEVTVLKATLRDTTASKNDEISRLKRESKNEVKKLNEELKELKRVHQNLIQELDESSKDNKSVTRRLSAANLTNVDLNHKVQALERENKILQNSLDKAILKIEDQAKTKSDRDVEVERLRLEQEQAKAEKALALREANARRAEEEYERKKELLQMQSAMRIQEKEQVQFQKERAKKKTIEEQQDRLLFARNMMQKTIEENGGSFRNYTPTQDVSTHPELNIQK